MPPLVVGNEEDLLQQSALDVWKGKGGRKKNASIPPQMEYQEEKNIHTEENYEKQQFGGGRNS